jgi:hypothetical protein
VSSTLFNKPGSPKWYQTGVLSASILFLETGRSHRVPNHQWRPWTRRFHRWRRADEVKCRRRCAAASPQITYMTPNKHVWELPTSTQLCATWHTDSLDMVVLPSTGASHKHNWCIDGGTSPEYFGYTLYMSPLIPYKCVQIFQLPQ